MSAYLNVNEWFGPTIQGEGRNAGQLVSFLRLAGCNLACSWCDSRHSWDWETFDRDEEVIRMPVADVAGLLSKLPGRITVSGGEPLLQSSGLAALMALLPEREWDLETNGTRPLGLTAGLWSNITASPKISPSAQDSVRGSLLAPDTLSVADLKFVISDREDLEAVDDFLTGSPVAPQRVWLMPEGTDTETLTLRSGWLAQAATERGFNFTTRLHVYGWSDARGH